MDAVDSEIDFSAGNAPRALDRLKAEHIGWIVTTNAQAAPQPSPVWFVWDDGRIVVYSLPGSAKLRNIEAHSDVAFMLNTDANGGDVTIINGAATVVTDGPGAETYPAYVAKYGEKIGAWETETGQKLADYSARIEITPRRLRTW